MRAIAMYSHSVYILAIEVATDMVTAVNNLDTIASIEGATSYDRAEKTRANDKVVVWFVIL